MSLRMKGMRYVLWAFLLMLCSCSTNPLTGESQLILQSREEDSALGTEVYPQLVQEAGGSYESIDPALCAYVRGVGNRLANGMYAYLESKPEYKGVTKFNYEFTVINTPEVNAWCLPGGKIGMNLGLLKEMNDEAELAAVLGHEITHAEGRHYAVQQGEALVLGLGLAIAGVALSNNKNGDWMIGLASVGAQLLMLKYSRDNESESDSYGMQWMATVSPRYNPWGAVGLMELFVKLSGDGRPPEILSTHPDPENRAKDNAQRAIAMGYADRTDMRERYVSQYAANCKSAATVAMAAQVSYTAGVKALQSGDRKLAMKMAEDAITRQGNNPKFHVLKAQCQLQNGQRDLALQTIKSGRAANPAFSYYALGLLEGQIYEAKGDSQRAINAYEESASLLSLAGTHMSLANLYDARGDEYKARQHYTKIATEAANAEDAGLVAMVEQANSWLAVHGR